MRRSKPLGVIFDFGDTVMRVTASDNSTEDRSPVSRATTCNKLLDFTVNEPDITREELQELANQLYMEFKLNRNQAMIEQDIITFLRMLCDTAGMTLSISYEEAAEIVWNSAYTLTPTEGISQVLDSLEKHRIKAGILSNSFFPASLMEKELVKYNLREKFSFFIASADYGIRKPHPMIFDIAARKMEFEPKDIWFAGDSIQKDIIGANGAGFYPVWYNPMNTQSDLDCECLEIHHWREFISIIESFK